MIVAAQGTPLWALATIWGMAIGLIGLLVTGAPVFLDLRRRKMQETTDLALIKKEVLGERARDGLPIKPGHSAQIAEIKELLLSSKDNSAQIARRVGHLANRLDGVEGRLDSQDVELARIKGRLDERLGKDPG